jgi:O-antigen ligase
LYFIIFDKINDIESIKYLLARTIQFLIISFSIFYHHEYYKDKFFTHIVYSVFLIILLGLFIDPFIFSGRYYGIIWNPNMLASFSTISFGIVFLKQEKLRNLDYVFLILFLIISLATGSRGALLGIPFAFFLKYGFSVRNIAYGILSIILYLFVVNLALETSINRLDLTHIFSDRTLQLLLAYETFLEKPWFGWGLSKYAFLDLKLAPDYLPENIKGSIISAHNGYLAILVQYGIIFASLILYIIFKKSFSVLYFFRGSRIGFKAIYSYIIIYALFESLYETMITGINEFHTILFWFSLAMLSYTKILTLDAD